MRKQRCCDLLNKLKAYQPIQVWTYLIITSLPGHGHNPHNSHYLTDLPVADVDPSIRISPFSKTLLMQMVLGVVGSDDQKCPIISLVLANKSTQIISKTFSDRMRSH
jgi:hypothetical protein